MIPTQINRAPKAETLTIIAVHDNGGSASHFARIPHHIADGMAFNAVTLPGFGNNLPNPALQTITDYAVYLLDIVGETPQPVVLLGMGIGGAILLEYIQHFPATVRGVILHAPTYPQRGFLLELMALPGMRKLAQWLCSAWLTRPIFKRIFFDDYRNIPPDILDRFFGEYRQCSVFGQMFDLITPEWFDSLQPSSVPAALVWGEKDKVHRNRRIYRELLPDSETFIIPGWGRFPMIEQPQDYARKISVLAHSLTS